MKTNILILCAASVLLSSCGNSYNTAFPAPTGEEKYADIIPAEIGGEAVSSEKLELEDGVYHGSRFPFGEVASIIMVQCANQEAIDACFKETVVPQLEEGYSSKASGKFNGM
ncbi:hypothetical protein N9B73_04360 [Verrucomicrobiales bacterium]|nr:hypothetical protein [Verrucomicrobiales bacterium]